MKYKKMYLGLLVGTLATGLLVNQAEAVPSFARQTGLACAACHTVFPELNSFGRSFKENGYTLTGIKQVEAKESKSASGLKFNQIPPLSAMLQVSMTNSKSQTPKTQMALPDQLSFFFAGEITPHMGSFIQMTLEGADGTFAMDNTDIRYANHAGDTTYGITLNNNPTVQDLWNSTPAWGYPFTTGADINQPLMAMDGGLPGTVAGLGAYADWSDGIYTELSLYRSTLAIDPQGVGASQMIDGYAPYWRLAWHTTMGNGDSLMVGTYGMRTSLVDSGTYAGPKDKYNDTVIDTQYEHTFANSNNMLSIHASYGTEKQTLDQTAAGASAKIKGLRLDGTYHWGYHATATLAYAANKVQSTDLDKAWTAQVSYLPWQNTKFTLQYVTYSVKDGATGSAASDNNTTLLQAWFMW